MKYIFSFLFAFIILSGCSVQEDKHEKGGKTYYYDIKTLLDGNAERLKRMESVSVRKETVLNGKKEMLVTALSDSEKTLDILSVVDINKPAWHGKYEEKKEKQMLSYTLKSDVAPVRNLTIFFYDTLYEYPKMIQAEIKDDNILRKSDKNIRIFFEGSTTTVVPIVPVLKSYEIEGTEQAIMRKPLRYFVNVEIIDIE